MRQLPSIFVGSCLNKLTVFLGTNRSLFWQQVDVIPTKKALVFGGCGGIANPYSKPPLPDACVQRQRSWLCDLR